VRVLRLVFLSFPPLTKSRSRDYSSVNRPAVLFLRAYKWLSCILIACLRLSPATLEFFNSFGFPVFSPKQSMSLLSEPTTRLWSMLFVPSRSIPVNLTAYYIDARKVTISVCFSFLPLLQPVKATQDPPPFGFQRWTLPPPKPAGLRSPPSPPPARLLLILIPVPSH